jgi:hypothetical protein
MDISLKILITTCLVNLSILIIVLSKKAKGINNKSVIFFCLSLISLIFWSVCNYLADTSASVTSALFWTQASFPPALYMGLSILLFSYVFPISRPRNKITIPLYVILVVFFSLASMSSLIIKDVSIQHGIGVSDVTVGILYPGILILLLLLIIHPTYIFIKNIKTLQGKNKDQVKYVLLGWTTFLTFAVITNAILPLITGSAIWSKFGPLASVFMSASISYAIIRHEFLDIKIIIQRGLVYSLLLSIITAVYLFLIFTFEYFFHSDDGTMILISAFLTTLVGIVGVPPLKAYFQKITDPIFFKDTYDYATVLSELTDILNNNIVLDTIIEKTESTLLRALRVEHVTFSFTDTVLDGGGFSLPVTSNSKPLGTLYVGVKRSGDAFTREDISLLKI